MAKTLQNIILYNISSLIHFGLSPPTSPAAPPPRIS